MFDDISLAPRGAEPVYVRLAVAIRARIEAGVLTHGERLPTVRGAARILGVNANTVQRAYNLLAQEGVLTSRRGAGTLVARAATAHAGPTAHQTQWLSARNQIEGTVQSIEVSGVMGEVVLALPGGQEIVAAITRTSVERLGLAVGDPALAIVKSTDVMVALPPGSTGPESPAGRERVVEKGKGTRAVEALEGVDVTYP